LAKLGIQYIDCGTSGGVYGLDRGYCLMVGGGNTAVATCASIFDALSPGINAAPRTQFDTPLTSAEFGWLHCGGPGAGHFVKMVHNGIEYGIMQAYAEGFNIIKNANAGAKYVREGDAEVAPMADPESYCYDIDVAEVAELWRRGSVVGSWLLDLTADVLRNDGQLKQFSGGVSDSGEGRWTVSAAVDLGVPAPVITTALFERFNSRNLGTFASKVLNGMRYMFGGHHVR
jgi:6-phosphogluconate dehydrogenase